MSENELRKKWFEWWQNTKRRAYTYQEKKLNQASDYDFYLEKFGRFYDIEGLRSKCAELGHGNLPAYRLKNLKKMFDDKVNRGEYDKEMQTGGVFTFILGLRDEFAWGFTNAEAYVVGINYYLRLVELGGQDPVPVINDDTSVELIIGIVRDMHANWKYYMDTASQADAKLGRIIDAHAAAHPEQESVKNLLLS